MNEIPEKSWFRAYLTDKQEVFEYFTENRGKRFLQHRFAFPYGQSVADFCTNGLNADKHRVERVAELLPEAADFLCPAWKQIFSAFYNAVFPFTLLLEIQLLESYHQQPHPLPVSLVSDFQSALYEITADANQLLGDCLNSTTENIPTRYWELWQDKPLAYPNVFMELVPQVTQFFGVTVPHPPTDLRLAYRNGTPLALTEVCYPKTVRELYDFLKSSYLRRGVRFKQCQLCGRYFAAVEGDRVEYCTRPYANGKTCREVGANRLYQMKQLSNPVTRAYNKAYKTHNARIRYGTMTREEFSDWSKLARDKREQCLNGQLSLEQFEYWLKL